MPRDVTLSAAKGDISALLSGLFQPLHLWYLGRLDGGFKLAISVATANWLVAGPIALISRQMAGREED